jgi:hypothetical protein
MTNEDKAVEIRYKLGIYADAYYGAMEMAKWKDEQFKGFLFELALKITTPKTDLDKALVSAFPMAGLNTVDDILTSLQNNWYDYQNKGTILNE